MLKIPFKLNSQSLCYFSKQSENSQLISQSSAIMWDENTKAIEAVVHSFRDVLVVDLPFGGKVEILGGDFQQVVPTVVGGTSAQTVQSSIIESYLWSNIKLLHLVDNIRVNQRHKLL